jgi:hypothetical protein
MISVKKTIAGTTIGATDGDIGRVDALIFDDESWTVRYLVVDTSSWLSGRKVLVSPACVRAIDAEGERVAVSLTRQQVESSPDLDADQPLTRQREVEYLGYYDLPHYWDGPFRWGPGPYPGATRPVDAVAAEVEARRFADAERLRGEPHLRRTTEVIGYAIAARDGDIGHIEDLLVDDGTWAIRYAVVDTRNWWPGKKVLLAPEWISRIDWTESKARVDLDRDAIRSAPEYDASRPIDRDYERRLHEHYGGAAYRAHSGRNAA